MTPDVVILQCVSKEESKDLVKEFHVKFCAGHYAVETIMHKLLRAGHYWPTIVADTLDFVKKYQRCQLFVDNLNNGHKWILIAMNYFAKWVEAILIKKATGQVAMELLEEKTITRFGVPSIDFRQRRVCSRPQNLQGSLDTCILQYPEIVLGNSTRR
eukprot:PITA_15653